MQGRDHSALEDRIGHHFQDTALPRRALTHRSYAAEKNLKDDNQRLEFLGDAVIQLVMTEYLFHLHPVEREGNLTKLRSALVRKEALAEAAKYIGLNEFILLGKGEIETQGYNRLSTLCDAFEALAGAIYLDAGLEKARDVIVQILRAVYPNPTGLMDDINPKGLLQEYTQKNLNAKPFYRVKETFGPEHQLIYVVEALVNDRLLAAGEGPSVKAAESAAAREALVVLLKPKASAQEKNPATPHGENNVALSP